MDPIADALTRASYELSLYESSCHRVHLDSSIIHYRAALDATPSNHPTIPKLRLLLANALQMRGEHLAKESEFREVVQILEESLRITSGHDPERPNQLAALGLAYFELYELLRDKLFLDRADALFADALDLAPVTHPDLPLFLFYRGRVLARQAFVAQSLDMTEAAIKSLEQSLEQSAVPYRARPRFFVELAFAWVCRSKLARQSDRNLDQTIRLSQQGVQEASGRPVYQHTCYRMLGICHYNRYFRGGIKDPDDLDRAIQAWREALNILQPDHVDWMTNAANLSAPLMENFNIRGSMPDLDAAITTLRQFLKYCPSTHQHRPARLSFLGKALTISFRNRGRLIQIDEAIRIHRLAVENSPADELCEYLLNCGGALRERFMHQRAQGDIDEAISIFRRALEIAPQSLRHSALAELAHALTIRSELPVDEGDINEAIQLFEEVIKDGMDVMDRPAQWSLFGIALRQRYQHYDIADDLEKAIVAFQTAFDNVDQSHSQSSSFASRLGVAQYMRYSASHRIRDLEDSVTNLRAAVSLTPSGHPFFALHRHQLAISLLSYGPVKHSDEIMFSLRTAAQDATSIIIDRFLSALQWAHLLHGQDHFVAALEAYELAINLLPRVAWLGLDQAVRYEASHHWAKLGSDAAACAISAGELVRAVELLEAGRSVLWNQLSQLRQEQHELRRIWPELASEMEEVARALESSMSRGSAEDMSDRAHYEQAAQQHHRLAEQWDSVLQKVRSIPAMHDFLQTASFYQLREAASAGPVVLVNASQYRCDGLVITKDCPVRNFELPSLNMDSVDGMVSLLYNILGVARDQTGASWTEVWFLKVLDSMWDDIGRPLWEAVKDLMPSSGLGRLWLVPTGALAFLPLHAAMPTSKIGKGLPDLAIISYTPTLSALLHARSGSQVSSISKAHRGSFRMLAVGQPKTPGKPALPCWAKEKVELSRLLPHDTITFVEHKDATVTHVLEQLRHHNFFHLCSHGVHDWENPYRSRLLLYDGPLTMSEIAKQRFTNADFAFLSACHTAPGGDLKSPDESLHIASGLHIAGFRSIIATMWGIVDKDAPEVTKVMYSHMTRENRAPCYTDAAQALHRAVQVLRVSGLPAFRWAPFIHIGL